MVAVAAVAAVVAVVAMVVVRKTAFCPHSNRYTNVKCKGYLSSQLSFECHFSFACVVTATKCYCVYPYK